MENPSDRYAIPQHDEAAKTVDDHHELALWYEWLFGPVPEKAANELRKLGHDVSD